MKVNHFESRLKFGKACTKDLRKLYFKSLVKNCLMSSKFLSNPFKDILGVENLKKYVPLIVGFVKTLCCSVGN